jgi:hypothetical protein
LLNNDSGALKIAPLFLFARWRVFKLDHLKADETRVRRFAI